VDSPTSRRDQRPVRSRQSRASSRIVESLEHRVVLSDWGRNLLGSALNSIGVVTGPVIAPGLSNSPTGQASQLETDIQALRTELSTLAAKSGVTVADLTSLAADSRAIEQAGSRIDLKSLGAAVNELATAIAGGTSTAQAQTDFTAVFANTSVSSATVTQAFTDLSKAIADSGVTSTDLSTVAADQAAIQKDLANLQNGGDSDGSGSGGDCGSGSSSGTGSSGSSGSSSASGSSSGSGSSTGTSTGGGTTPPLPTGSPSQALADSTTTPDSATSGGSTDPSNSPGQTTTTQSSSGHHHVTHVAKPSAKVHPAKTQAKVRHSHG
jgi:hypothetical protein